MGERYAFGVDEPWKAWVAYAKAGWDTITRQTLKPWLPSSLVPNGPTMWPVQASSATMGLRHVLWAWCRPNIWLVLHLSRRFFRWCPSLFKEIWALLKTTVGWGLYGILLVILPILGIIRINSGCRVLPHTFAVSKVLSSSTASSLTFLQLKHEVRGIRAWAFLPSFGMGRACCRYGSNTAASAGGAGSFSFQLLIELLALIEVVLRCPLNFGACQFVRFNCRLVSHGDMLISCGKSANEPSIYKRKNPRSKKNAAESDRANGLDEQYNFWSAALDQQQSHAIKSKEVPVLSVPSRCFCFSIPPWSTCLVSYLELTGSFKV